MHISKGNRDYLIRSNVELSVGNGNSENCDGCSICIKDDTRKKKNKKTKENKMERRPNEKLAEEGQSSVVSYSSHFEKIVNQEVNNENTVQCSYALESNRTFNTVDGKIVGGAELLVKMNDGNCKRSKKKRREDNHCENTPKVDLISPYFQEHGSEEDENHGDEKLRTKHSSSSVKMEGNNSASSLQTKTDQNEALRDNDKGAGKERKSEKVVRPVVLALCAQKRVKAEIEEDDHKEKMDPCFSAENIISKSVPLNDIGGATSKKAERDDLFSRFAYKGSSSLRTTRENQHVKNANESQVYDSCFPNFEIEQGKERENKEGKKASKPGIVVRRTKPFIVSQKVKKVLSKRRRNGEKDCKKERMEVQVGSPYFVNSMGKKAGKPDVVVKRTEPFIFSEKNSSNGAHFTENGPMFSPEVCENLNDEKVPQDKVKVKKVLSKRRRNDEKNCKKERMKVQVVSPYFMNSMEEKAAKPNIVVKKTEPFIVSDKSSCNGGHVTENDPVYSPNVCDNLKEEEIPQDKTRVKQTLLKRRRNDKQGWKKGRMEVQVVSPFFINSMEEKAAKPVIVVKRTEPFIVSGENSCNGAHVTNSDPVFSPNVSENLKEERVPQEKTKVMKTLSNRRKNGKNGCKKGQIEVQVVSSYFMNSMEKKKATEPDIVVKKTKTFIVSDKNSRNVVPVTESDPSSPVICENLEEEKVPQDKTKVKKVLSKRRRNDEKGCKKGWINVEVVSPNLMNSVGKEAVSQGKHVEIKSEKPCAKNCSTTVKVSPYFHNIPKDNENAVADLSEGGIKCKVLPKRAKPAAVIDRNISASQKRDEAYRRLTSDNTYKPPRSHFNLLQEDHAHDPWRVLVICMLLNRTTGLQAKRVISELFTLCPNAKIATEVSTKEIEKVIQSLGLQKKRALMIQRFSCEYLNESWTYVTQLHGVGKYAADAYAIFCTGKWDRVSWALFLLFAVNTIGKFWMESRQEKGSV